MYPYTKYREVIESQFKLLAHGKQFLRELFFRKVFFCSFADLTALTPTFRGKSSIVLCAWMESFSLLREG
jgi:hypothetical protein